MYILLNEWWFFEEMFRVVCHTSFDSGNWHFSFQCRIRRDQDETSLPSINDVPPASPVALGTQCAVLEFTKPRISFWLSFVVQFLCPNNPLLWQNWPLPTIEHLISHNIGRFSTMNRVNPASPFRSGRGTLYHATLTPDVMINTVNGISEISS